MRRTLRQFFFVPVASMVVLPVAGAPISVMLDSGVIRNIVILVSILALGGDLRFYVRWV